MLGLVPLRQESRRVNGAQDPLGLVRRSPDWETIEWAPEIEYAVCDGVDLEFEVPMENSHVEAYKGAGQITFGIALNHRFIHGAHGYPPIWTGFKCVDDHRFVPDRVSIQ
jgi:hypothetical protein